MGIDDHELTHLDVVTASTLCDTKKGPVMGFSMNMLILERGDLFMLLDKWNGSTAEWMTDPKLWEVPRELKPQMDMCSHSPLILVWFLCSPSGSLQMMRFSNTLMFSSHHLTFWDASVLDHGITADSLMKINQEGDDSLLQDFIFDEFGDLQQQLVQHLDVFWDSRPAESGEHTFHAYLNESNPAEQEWKSLNPYFGWQSEQVIQNTYKVTPRFGVLFLNMIT